RSCCRSRPPRLAGATSERRPRCAKPWTPRRRRTSREGRERDRRFAESEDLRSGRRIAGGASVCIRSLVGALTAGRGGFWPLGRQEFVVAHDRAHDRRRGPDTHRHHHHRRSRRRYLPHRRDRHPPPRDPSGTTPWPPPHENGDGRPGPRSPGPGEPPHLPAGRRAENPTPPTDTAAPARPPLGDPATT